MKLLVYLSTFFTQIVLKAVCCNIEMVSTKHCSWGKCLSDSWYPKKLAKPLQEMITAGLKAFIYTSQNRNVGLWFDA